MTDTDALLKAILDAPDDDTLRLAYKDALEESDPRWLAHLLANNPYVPDDLYPTEAQRRFLECQTVRAALVSGQRPAGKTTALLLSALMYVEYPGYHAILLAHEFPGQHTHGSLTLTLRKWANGRCRVVLQGGRFLFPSGASIDVRTHYAGREMLARQEYSFVGVDNAGLMPLETIQDIAARARPPRRPQVPFRLRLTGETQLVMPVGTTIIGAEERPGMWDEVKQ